MWVCASFQPHSYSFIRWRLSAMSMRTRSRKAFTHMRNPRWDQPLWILSTTGLLWSSVSRAEDISLKAMIQLNWISMKLWPTVMCGFAYLSFSWYPSSKDLSQKSQFWTTKTPRPPSLSVLNWWAESVFVCCMFAVPDRPSLRSVI